MADRNVSIGFSADVSSFMAGVTKMRTATSGFITGLEKSAAKRKALTDLGSAAGKVGLVAAAGLGAAVVASARFDSAMSRVEAATHESTQNMDALREAAIQAGQDTRYSATEAADGITEMAKAGVSTANVLSGGLTGALNLAAAGEMAVADAAETAASTMNQFGLAGDQVGHIADVLAATAGKAQGEVSDVALAMKYVGPVAAQMGVSLEETAGAIGELASQGIVASQAGTGLRGMLMSLTSPSEKAANTMKELGINVYDAQGNFVGFDGIAGQLHKTMGDLSASERDAAFGVMFGNAQITAARILYDGGAGAVKNWTKQVDDSGYAAETAAMKMDNLAGDFERLKGSLETALIGTGSGAQGPLRSLVQGLEDVVNAYNKLPSPVQGGVAGVLGLTALTGGSIYALSRVATGIANTRSAMADLAIQAPKTASAMKMIGKGIAFTAVIEGLNLLDATLDDVFSTDLNQTDLARSLTALSQGRVSGTLMDTFSDDLSGFSHALDVTDSKWQHFVQGPLGDVIPGDSGLDEAEANIQAIDEALAGMVETGQKGQASKIFDHLVEAAERGGNSVDDVRAALSEYQVALDNAGHKDAIGQLFKGVDGALSGLIPELHNVGGAASDAAGDVDALNGALQSLSGFFDRRAALRDYRQSLADLTDSLKKQPDNFNRSTAAGRKHEAMLDGVATNALKVADDMSRANKIKFLRGTADDIEAAAKRMGVLSNKDIQKVIDKLRETANTKADPKTELKGDKEVNGKLDAVEKHLGVVDRTTATPKIRADASQALAAAQAVINKLAGIHDKWVTIHTNQVSSGNAGYGGHDPGDPNPNPRTAGPAPRMSTYATQRSVLDVGGQRAAAPVVVNPNVSAVARLHPDDLRALEWAVERGSYGGSRDGTEGRQRAGRAARRAGA